MIELFDRVQAADRVSAASDSAIRFFDKSHSAIAKPEDENDEIYRWVLETIRAEIARLNAWEAIIERAPSSSSPFCLD